MTMQQQQQHADFDLLAVFPSEEKANAAAEKLRKEGFGEEEVYQLQEGSVGAGEFRVHGPSTARSEFFLQTQRSGPNPVLGILLVIIAGIVFGALGFVAHFASPSVLEPQGWIIGLITGVVLGIIVVLTRPGRVRGDIGQDMSRLNTASARPAPGARTVVALRLPDAQNVSRRSRARAILLNGGGKIDRSVGRRE
jgi:F0F1-type ATP synthase assembly protein I